jgi:PAS domain S-box-containing protein
MARRRKPSSSNPARRAVKKRPKAAARIKQSKAQALFAALDRAHQASADEKIRGLLHELQVHGEEITAQNDQLRRTQAELEQARDRYADLYDFAPIGYLTVNRAGAITDVNLAGAALLGHKRAFLERLPLAATVLSSDRARLRAFLTECWKSQAGPPPTLELSTKDGRVVRFTCRSQGAGRAARLFTAVVDVTDERRLEQESATALNRIKALIERLVSIQEDERRRMARNLHDHLGQQLTALRFNIGSLKDTSQGGEAFRKRLEAIDKIAAGIDRDLDFLAWELRPVALDDVGLNAALGGFITEWSSTQNVNAEFHDSTAGLLRLSPQIESQLYRIVQEALNNVAKHAQAKRVSVLLERRGDEAILIVEDDGAGFDADAVAKSDRRHARIGLISMQERAALVGGRVQFESAPGKGTTVFVRLPARTVPAMTT